MKKLFIAALIAVLSLPQSYAAKKVQKDLFPDGTEIPEWFRNTEAVNLQALGNISSQTTVSLPTAEYIPLTYRP